MPTWDDVGAGGLGLPEPPEELVGQLRVVGPQRWGTRERTGSLRALRLFSDEFVAGTHPGDYVLAETTEVGQHTPVTLYLLAYGNLGLFIEADARANGSAGPGRGTLALAADLQDLYISAVAERQVETCKFVVVHSDFGAQRWEFHSTAPEGGIDPIWSVLDWFAHRTGRAR